MPYDDPALKQFENYYLTSYPPAQSPSNLRPVHLRRPLGLKIPLSRSRNSLDWVSKSPPLGLKNPLARGTRKIRPPHACCALYPNEVQNFLNFAKHRFPVFAILVMFSDEMGKVGTATSPGLLASIRKATSERREYGKPPKSWG